MTTPSRAQSGRGTSTTRNGPPNESNLTARTVAYPPGSTTAAGFSALVVVVVVAAKVIPLRRR